MIVGNTNKEMISAMRTEGNSMNLAVGTSVISVEEAEIVAGRLGGVDDIVAKR